MKTGLKLFLILSAGLFFTFSCRDVENRQTTDSPSKTENLSKTEATPETKPTLDELAEARNIFMEKCVRCHKEDGTGGKTNIDGVEIRVPNFRSERMKREPDDDFIKAITKGIPDEGMPSFKEELSQEQIKQLVAFIRKEFQGK